MNVPVLATPLTQDAVAAVLVEAQAVQPTVILLSLLHPVNIRSDAVIKAQNVKKILFMYHRIQIKSDLD